MVNMLEVKPENLETRIKFGHFITAITLIIAMVILAISMFNYAVLNILDMIITGILSLVFFIIYLDLRSSIKILNLYNAIHDLVGEKHG